MKIELSRDEALDLLGVLTQAGAVVDAYFADSTALSDKAHELGVTVLEQLIDTEIVTSTELTERARSFYVGRLAI